MAEDVLGQVPAVPAQEAAPPAPVAAGDKPDSTPNEEAARYRRALREAEKERDALKAQLQDRADAELSELQKAQKALADHAAALTAAQERTRAAELKAALLTAAPKVNLLPAAYDDALKLINPALIEWDADQPTGASIKRALEALVKDRPYLIATNAPPAASPSAFAPQGAAAPSDDPQARAATARISGRL